MELWPSIAYDKSTMRFPDHRTLSVLLTGLLVALVSILAYSARRILLLFVFAIFFAYLINPVVKFLQRHSLFFRNLRGPAVVEVYLAFLIVIAALGMDLRPDLRGGPSNWSMKFRHYWTACLPERSRQISGGSMVGLTSRRCGSSYFFSGTEITSRIW